MYSRGTDKNIHFTKDPLATFIQKRYIKDEQKSFSLTFNIYVYNLSSEKKNTDSEEKTDYCHLEIRFGDYISKLRLFEYVLNQRSVFTPSYKLLFVYMS